MKKTSNNTQNKPQDQSFFVIYKGLKENTEHSVEVEIKPFNEELHYLQSLVGGYLEHFIIDDDLDRQHIDMWIDEEGKLKMEELKPTWSLCDPQGNIYDVIFGNCVFSKYNDDGETLGLTIDEVHTVIDFLLSCPRGYLQHKDSNQKISSVLCKVYDFN